MACVLHSISVKNKKLTNKPKIGRRILGFLRIVQENRLLCPSEYLEHKIEEFHSHFLSKDYFLIFATGVNLNHLDQRK